MANKLLVLVLALVLLGCGKSPNQSSSFSPAPLITPAFQMSQVAEDLVTDSEVSSTSSRGIDGGHSYYDKYYQYATYPGSGSGATIAIGVDLSQESAHYTTTCWSPYFSYGIVEDFASCAGDTSSSSARADVARLHNIAIVWNTALSEFNIYEIPNYYSLCVRVFPGLDNLTINAQSAVLSCVYNRGSSMVGASRVDMRVLRQAVENRNYSKMAAAILHMNVTMRSEWEQEGIYAGMSFRRISEAKLILTPDS